MARVDFKTTFWTALLILELKISGYCNFLESSNLRRIDETLGRCNGIELRELKISQVQDHFRKGHLTSVELTKCYLERISQMNPVLNAVLEVNTNAIKEAEKADAERKSGMKTEGLHGIPVLLKDNIGTKDFMETTAGSKVLVGTRVKNDATVVKALKRTGAVILGKTNLSEFAGIRGNYVPSGWSGRGGTTKCPYKLSADPLGSSSGSAASVATNLAMVSIGTETDGSLILPAGVAGLFTLKPTLGSVSMKGIIPVASAQDCVGPMARTVDDLAIAFDGMNSRKRKRYRGCNGSFQNCLKEEKLTKSSAPLRVGIVRCPSSVSAYLDSVKWQTPEYNDCRLMNVVEKTLIKSLNVSLSNLYFHSYVKWDLRKLQRITRDNEDLVIKYDFKREIRLYLTQEVSHNESTNRHAGSKNSSNPKITTLRDIIEWNKKNCNTYDQQFFIMANNENADEYAYLKAKKVNRRASRRLLLKMMDRDNLEAIMFPTPIPASEKVYLNIIYWGHSLAAIAGYPSLHIPIGAHANGVPYGVTLVGRPNSEAKLLQIAYLIEKFHPGRMPPKFLP